MALIYFPGSVVSMKSSSGANKNFFGGSTSLTVGRVAVGDLEPWYSTLKVIFTTPKYDFRYFSVRLKLYVKLDEHISHNKGTFRYAICSAPNDDLYVHAHGDVTDENQLASGIVSIDDVQQKVWQTGGDVPVRHRQYSFVISCLSDVAMLSNTEYYVYLWDQEYVSVVPDIDSGGSVSTVRPTYTTIEGEAIVGGVYAYRSEALSGAEAGFVFVENTEGFDPYQIFIDNGTEYVQHLAYRDTGDDWVLCS